MAVPRDPHTVTYEPPPLTPRELADLDVDAHLADAERKQAFVTPMFEHIAPRYDDFTRLFSFGMDARWKGELMRWFDGVTPTHCQVLDVACGTGDLALAAARARPDAQVFGVDAARGMIEVARRRIAPGDTGRVTFATGDLTRLELADASADVILAGYALRNVPHYGEALAELRRVLRPGGHLFTLDFHCPSNAVWRELFLGYLQLSGGIVGWYWHRAPIIYSYIAHSIRHFVTPEEFHRVQQLAGFDIVCQQQYLGGGITLTHAVGRP